MDTLLRALSSRRRWPAIALVSAVMATAVTGIVLAGQSSVCDSGASFTAWSPERRDSVERVIGESGLAGDTWTRVDRFATLWETDRSVCEARHTVGSATRCTIVPEPALSTSSQQHRFDAVVGARDPPAGHLLDVDVVLATTR